MKLMRLMKLRNDETSSKAYLALCSLTRGFNFDAVFGGRAESCEDEPWHAGVLWEKKAVLVLGLEREVVRDFGTRRSNGKKRQN